MVEVFVHRYFGCLCTYEVKDDYTETIYGFKEDSDELGSYGIALLNEMLTDAPWAWEKIGEL